MKTEILKDFNLWLYNEWEKLPNREGLTFPYLITPTDEYCKAGTKVLVLNWETNGWGETEKKDGKINSFSDLEDIYIRNINKEWEDLNSNAWRMYYALRSLSEGCTPLSELKGEVGFIQSNVALIGKQYGNPGYDNSITELLQEALSKQIKLLQPDIIICGIGFGTIGHTERPYLSILEGTNLGHLVEDTTLPECDQLHKLIFEHGGEIEIYGHGHPRNLSRDAIVESIKNILLDRIKNKE